MAGRVGIDIGGTFTDFALRSSDGRLDIHKQLTTPADPAAAALAGRPCHNTCNQCVD